MSMQKDAFYNSLAVFMGLLDDLLYVKMTPSKTINECGSREEIVAYLILKGGLLSGNTDIFEKLVSIANITPQLNRPILEQSFVENTARIDSYSEQVADILGRVLASDVATSPLVKEFDFVRAKYSIERMTIENYTRDIFDRINSG